MSCNEVKFAELAELFHHCELFKRQPGKKVSDVLRLFVNTRLPEKSDDFFQLLRLMLPQFDSRVYNLKEAGLATVLLEAANQRHTDRATRLKEWRSGGRSKLGNLASIAEEELFRSLGEAGKDLTVAQINEGLSNLQSASSMKERAAVLRKMMVECPARQMKYIVMIILKDLKVGLSEGIVLRHFHQDAPAVFNLVSNLEEVCVKLKDRSERYPRQDVEVGSNVRVQRAAKAKSIADVFKKMKKQDFVVETKFDGWRIQLHVDEQSIKYYSRSFVEHGGASSFNMFDAAVREQVVPGKAILDGELVAWHKERKQFEPFGHLKTVMLLIRDGAPRDTRVKFEGLQYTADPEYSAPLMQDLELIFVAFDIIYFEDRSVMHLPLRERHQVLLNAIRPPGNSAGVALGGSGLSGRICPLVPLPGPEWGGLGKDWSVIGRSQEDIQQQFDAALQHQEEGIVVKALNSEWVPNDKHSGAWVKLKPDYVQEQEIDALIIGGYYGTGRNGGKIAEFLLGIAVPSPYGDTRPHFGSFTKVATGFSEKERAEVREKLAPAMTKAKGAPVPRFLTCQKSSKVTPDVWISDPAKSVVLQVQGDVRLITSAIFSTGYSLRFPRVTRIRYDKSCHDVMTVDELKRIVEENKGIVMGPTDKGNVSGSRKKAKFQKSPGGMRSADIVDRYRPVDVSGVQRTSDMLKDCSCYFLAHGNRGKQSLEELVARLGGKTYQSLTKTVTHILAPPEILDSKSKISHSFSAVRDRDVLSIDWLDSCLESGHLAMPLPRHYLNISAETLRNLADCDSFGDSFFCEVGSQDVTALLRRVAQLPPFEKARHYTRGLGLSTQRQYEAWASHSRASFAVLHPETVYQGKGWKSWADWLCPAGAKKLMKFHEAQEWVKSSGLSLRVRDAAEWQDWASSPGRPDAMPSEPHKLYRAQHQWVSWEDWLSGSHGAGAEAAATAPRSDQPGRRSSSEVVDAVEEELAESGLGVPAPFRGCRFLIVDLELLHHPSAGGQGSRNKPGSAASLDGFSATQAVAKLRSRNLRCKVRLGGGLPVAALEVDTCSHIVVCGPAPVMADDVGGEGSDHSDVTEDLPARLLKDLLSSLKAMGVDSAAFAELHRALLAGNLFIVTPRWVEDQARSSRTSMASAELAPSKDDHSFLADPRGMAWCSELWQEAIGIDVELANLRAQVLAEAGNNAGTKAAAPGPLDLRLARRLGEEGTIEALAEAAGLCEGLLDAAERQAGDRGTADEVRALLLEVQGKQGAAAVAPTPSASQKSGTPRRQSRRNKRKAPETKPSDIAVAANELKGSAFFSGKVQRNASPGRTRAASNEDIDIPESVPLSLPDVAMGASSWSRGAGISSTVEATRPPPGEVAPKSTSTTKDVAASLEASKIRDGGSLPISLKSETTAGRSGSAAAYGAGLHRGGYSDEANGHRQPPKSSVNVRDHIASLLHSDDEDEDVAVGTSATAGNALSTGAQPGPLNAASRDHLRNHQADNSCPSQGSPGLVKMTGSSATQGCAPGGVAALLKDLCES